LIIVQPETVIKWHRKGFKLYWRWKCRHKVGRPKIPKEVRKLIKDRPFFFFVHFAEPDHLGHAQGENSNEYNDALISDDLWTGKIMQKVKELGHTTVMLSSTAAYKHQSS